MLVGPDTMFCGFPSHPAPPTLIVALDGDDVRRAWNASVVTMKSRRAGNTPPKYLAAYPTGPYRTHLLACLPCMHTCLHACLLFVAAKHELGY